MLSIRGKFGEPTLRPTGLFGVPKVLITVSVIAASIALVWMVPEKLFSVFSWGAGYGRAIFLLHCPVWIVGFVVVIIGKRLQAFVWTVPVFACLPTMLFASELIGISIFGDEIRWGHLFACVTYLVMLTALTAFVTDDRRAAFTAWCYTFAAQLAPSIIVAYISSLNLVC